jgi:light-regulated signal transduction histidine kinase (bacteriophytochrome)
MAIKEECRDNGELPFLAERIGSASQQLQKVVDSILMLSRLSRTELKAEQVNLSELAQKTANNLLAEHPNRDVRYIIQPDMIVTADRALMEVCMGNLIGNAFKYSSQMPAARIEVGCEMQGDKSVYYVRDNGVGFDMSYADKLFTPFERLHQQEEFPGIGIGLATVQKIIERHSGRLWAEGGVGEGATFYFTIQY